MKLRKVSAHVLVITSRERWFFYLSLPVLVFLCGRVLTEFLDTGVPPFVLAGCAALVFAWVMFACHASDTETVLDKNRAEFRFASTGVFGAREEFRCALSGIRDVVLESANGEEIGYRFGFVTAAGIKYPSRIFASSVEKKHDTIHRYLFGSDPGSAARPGATGPHG